MVLGALSWGGGGVTSALGSCPAAVGGGQGTDGCWEGEQALGSGLGSLWIPFLGHTDSHTCGILTKPIMC